MADTQPVDVVRDVKALSLADVWRLFIEAVGSYKELLDTMTRKINEAAKAAEEGHEDTKNRLLQECEELQQRIEVAHKSNISLLREGALFLIQDYIIWTGKYLTYFLSTYVVVYLVKWIIEWIVTNFSVTIPMVPPWIPAFSAILLLSVWFWRSLQILGRRLYPFVVSFFPGTLQYIYYLLFIPEEVSLKGFAAMFWAVFSITAISVAIVMGANLWTVVFVVLALLVAFLFLASRYLKSIPTMIGSVLTFILIIRATNSVLETALNISIMEMTEMQSLILVGALLIFIMWFDFMIHLVSFISLAVSWKLFGLSELIPAIGLDLPKHVADEIKDETLKEITTMTKEQLDEVIRMSAAEKMKNLIALTDKHGRKMIINTRNHSKITIKDTKGMFDKVKDADIKIHKIQTDAKDKINKMLTIASRGNHHVVRDGNGNIMYEADGSLQGIGSFIAKKFGDRGITKVGNPTLVDMGKLGDDGTIYGTASRFNPEQIELLGKKPGLQAGTEEIFFKMNKKIYVKAGDQITEASKIPRKGTLMDIAENSLNDRDKQKIMDAAKRSIIGARNFANISGQEIFSMSGFGVENGKLKFKDDWLGESITKRVGSASIDNYTTNYGTYIMRGTGALGLTNADGRTTRFEKTGREGVYKLGGMEFSTEGMTGDDIKNFLNRGREGGAKITAGGKEIGIKLRDLTPGRIRELEKQHGRVKYGDMKVRVTSKKGFLGIPKKSVVFSTGRMGSKKRISIESRNVKKFAEKMSNLHEITGQRSLVNITPGYTSWASSLRSDIGRAESTFTTNRGLLQIQKRGNTYVARAGKEELVSSRDITTLINKLSNEAGYESIAPLSKMNISQDVNHFSDAAMDRLTKLSEDGYAVKKSSYGADQFLNNEKEFRMFQTTELSKRLGLKENNPAVQQEVDRMVAAANAAKGGHIVEITHGGDHMRAIVDKNGKTIYRSLFNPRQKTFIRDDKREQDGSKGYANVANSLLIAGGSSIEDSVRGLANEANNLGMRDSATKETVKFWSNWVSDSHASTAITPRGTRPITVKPATSSGQIDEKLKEIFDPERVQTPEVTRIRAPGGEFRLRRIQMDGKDEYVVYDAQNNLTTSETLNRKEAEKYVRNQLNKWNLRADSKADPDKARDIGKSINEMKSISKETGEPGHMFLQDKFGNKVGWLSVKDDKLQLNTTEKYDDWVPVGTEELGKMLFHENFEHLADEFKKGIGDIVAPAPKPKGTTSRQLSIDYSIKQLEKEDLKNKRDLIKEAVGAEAGKFMQVDADSGIQISKDGRLEKVTYHKGRRGPGKPDTVEPLKDKDINGIFEDLKIKERAAKFEAQKTLEIGETTPAKFSQAQISRIRNEITDYVDKNPDKTELKVVKGILSKEEGGRLRPVTNTEANEFYEKLRLQKSPETKTRPVKTTKKAKTEKSFLKIQDEVAKYIDENPEMKEYEVQRSPSRPFIKQNIYKKDKSGKKKAMNEKQLREFYEKHVEHPKSDAEKITPAVEARKESKPQPSKTREKKTVLIKTEKKQPTTEEKKKPEVRVPPGPAETEEPKGKEQPTIERAAPEARRPFPTPELESKLREEDVNVEPMTQLGPHPEKELSESQRELLKLRKVMETSYNPQEIEEAGKRIFELRPDLKGYAVEKIASRKKELATRAVFIARNQWHGIQQRVERASPEELEKIKEEYLGASSRLSETQKGIMRGLVARRANILEIYQRSKQPKLPAPEERPMLPAPEERLMLPYKTEEFQKDLKYKAELEVFRKNLREPKEPVVPKKQGTTKVGISESRIQADDKRIDKLLETVDEVKSELKVTENNRSAVADHLSSEFLENPRARGILKKRLEGAKSVKVANFGDVSIIKIHKEGKDDYIYAFNKTKGLREIDRESQGVKPIKIPDEE